MILATLRTVPGQRTYPIHRPIYNFRLRCNYIDLPYAILECRDNDYLYRLRHLSGYPWAFSLRFGGRRKMTLFLGPVPADTFRLVLWGERGCDDCFGRAET